MKISINVCNGTLVREVFANQISDMLAYVACVTDKGIMTFTTCMTNVNWESFIGKAIIDVSQVYGGDLDELIRRLDYLYSKNNNTDAVHEVEFEMNNDLIDTKALAGHVFNKFAYDCYITPRLTCRGYKVKVSEKRGYVIMKEGDDRSFIF